MNTNNISNRDSWKFRGYIKNLNESLIKEEDNNEKIEKHKLHYDVRSYQRPKYYRSYGNLKEILKYVADKSTRENNGGNIKENQIEDLRNQIKDLKNEIKEKGTKIFNLEKEKENKNKNKQNECEEKERPINKIKEDNEEMKKEIKKFINENNDSQNQNKELIRQKDDEIKIINEKTEKQIKELKKKLIKKLKKN